MFTDGTERGVFFEVGQTLRLVSNARGGITPAHPAIELVEKFTQK
jgi:hypothetical protein